jgi:glycosyltransferase involved in cell wall biosynthesis
MKHSIIIPTAKRPSAIKGAIKSILAISPWDMEAEIVVVDNNSDDELASGIKSYCEGLEGRVRYVRERSPGLGAARHRGLREAKSDTLSFIDDDVEVRETWLQAIIAGFSNENIHMIGGPSIPKFSGTVPPWFFRYIQTTPYGGWSCPWLSLIDIGKNIVNIDPNYIWGLNFSIRKDIVIKLNGFHPDLLPEYLQRWQGDGETGLTMKVKKAGLMASYSENAGVYHLCGNDRLNVEHFCKRAYYQGVCDSYAQIRSGIAPKMKSKSMRIVEYRNIIRSIIFVFISSLLRFQAFESDYRFVKNKTDRAYMEGWRFHQSEAALDPHLQRYIRKLNYFDTKIDDM